MKDEPAFPCRYENYSDKPVDMGYGVEVEPKSFVQFSGMSLRDYFAAEAMQAAVTGAKFGGAPGTDEFANTADLISRGAYEIADAMLEAREAK